MGNSDSKELAVVESGEVDAQGRGANSNSISNNKPAKELVVVGDPLLIPESSKQAGGGGDTLTERSSSEEMQEKDKNAPVLETDHEALKVNGAATNQNQNGSGTNTNRPSSRRNKDKPSSGSKKNGSVATPRRKNRGSTPQARDDMEANKKGVNGTGQPITDEQVHVNLAMSDLMAYLQVVANNSSQLPATKRDDPDLDRFVTSLSPEEYARKSAAFVPADVRVIGGTFTRYGRVWDLPTSEVSALFFVQQLAGVTP